MEPGQPWNLVTPGDLPVYPCGVHAGESLRLTKPLVIRDHLGTPTGVQHEPGETWTVLAGVAGEPTVLWLRSPAGKDHTWDDATLLDWFERVEHIEIDLSAVADARSLHALLADRLGLPPYYGHSFDALDEVLSDPDVSLPQVLLFKGWRLAQHALPSEAALLRECFRECDAAMQGRLHVTYAD
jgi:RNAse (barnase) inhibitor barstar